MGFTVNGGNVTDIFITEAEFLDRFVGNQLWTWGSGASGQLGNNSIVNRSSPVQTVASTTNWRQVTSDTYSIASIKTDGTLWMWGSGLNGRIGNNALVNQSSPVQTISAGTNWRDVGVGGGNSVGIKTDGTLWVWGVGAGGQIGNNAVTDRSSPTQTVSVTNNWRQVSVGNYGVAAIKTDGTLWTWGCGLSGTLGNNSTINRSSPVQTVSVGTTWKTVSFGKCSIAATKTDGTLWLWGCNTNGQLGNNSTVSQSSPVQTVSSTTDWKSISAGSYFTGAIKTDGTLWLWGLGDLGRLANNSTISQSSPVQTIAGGTNWKQIAAGWAVGAAVKTDGTLWMWANGNNGQMGDNIRVIRSSPVQTLTGTSAWKEVTVGRNMVSAVTFNS